MKKLIMPTLILLLFSSCITDRRINKQVAKATPGRVLGLIQKNYPHLFTVNENSVSIDTSLFIPITVNLEESNLDSIIDAYELIISGLDTTKRSNCDSIFNNLLLKNKDLELLIQKINGKYKILLTRKPKAIHDTVEVPVTIKAPCPTIKTPKQNFYRNRWWEDIFRILLFIIIFGGLIYLGWRLDKRYYKKKFDASKEEDKNKLDDF